MDTLTIVGLAGTFTGSAITALIARRASNKSEDVKREMFGPGDEPSLRKMIVDNSQALTDHRTEVAKATEGLHNDLGMMAKRIESLERAVFTRIEKRLGKVEEAAYDLLRGSARSSRKTRK